MASNEFDVFLSHNSRDKPLVRELAKLLQQRKIRVWLDEEELVPGEPWQKGLERGLLTSASVAVCLGQHPMGRWQDPEMRVALNLAATRQLRVLPILLPGASESPEISAFLQLYTWVDLRGGFAAAGIDRAVWGITGKKGSGSVLPRFEGENPFGQVGPIRDPARFVGRQWELRRLNEMLRHGSVVIVGSSKVGKTSLMLRVATAWSGEVLGPFDFQLLENEEDFLYQLAKAMGAKAPDWRALREQLQSHHHVLILLDELDAAPAAGVGITLFTRIRAVLNSNPRCIVLASAHVPPHELYKGAGVAGSPAFNLLQHFALGELPRREAELLLDHPWASEAPQLEAEAKELLVAQAGLHPYRLQRAAFHYLESCRAEGYNWFEHWQYDIGYLQ